MKKYGLPLIVIVLGSLALYLIRTYIGSTYVITQIASACVLFVFGVYLNSFKSRKGDTWVQKFIVMGLFVVFLLIQMGMISIKPLNNFLDIIDANRVVFYMFYVYFGYIFF